MTEKNSISPEIWGPTFWKVFHVTAFGYPDSPNKEDKVSYQHFYTNFTKVLPCDTCSHSAQRSILKTDWEYTLSTRERLIKWTYEFHNEVNKKLGKKSPSFEDFFDNALIFKSPSECSNLVQNIIIVILLLLLIYNLLF